MKEFRWGRKAMTAVLVTSIVSAPLLPTESIFLPKAEAASVATSNVNAEIDQIANRFFKFYQYADAKTLGMYSITSVSSIKQMYSVLLLLRAGICRNLNQRKRKRHL